jgi:Ca-dependent carbohydrate-binding module xylan-binding
MSTETLNFKITLSGTFWDKRPKFSIWIDDTKIQDGEITSAEHQTIEFSQELSETDHQLKIRLENKEDTDVVQENGNIVKDMLLNIEDITIDDISMGFQLWKATYYPDEKKMFNGKEIESITGCVNLGWNGSYVVNFSSPFYIWLLENS